MSIESIVFFFILLFLSLLALAIRWLHERIRREIAYRGLKDLFGPDEETPEEPSPEKKPERKKPEPTRISQKPMPPIETPGGPISRKRRTLRSLPRLRTPADLRNGIILMTILGPCRALEHQREDYSTPGH